MGRRAGLYAGFLYGVNVPDGIWLKSADVETKLRNGFRGLGYAKCVGDADNVLLETAVQMTEEEIISRLRALLGIKDAVVIAADVLRRVYDAARESLKAGGYTDRAPFILNRDGVAWELGVVLSSADLAAGGAFSPTKNARLLEVIEQRAVLVEKRCATTTGSRIMWGNVVINPVRSHLRRLGLSSGCLTSRAISRIGEIVAAVDGFQAARRRPSRGKDRSSGWDSTDGAGAKGSEVATREKGASTALPVGAEPDTEIASQFTVGRYWQLRPHVDPAVADTQEWTEIRAVFRRRISERFLKPIAELARHDRLENPPTRAGFAILALDCLLIDAIQAFRQGRVGTGEVSPARSFKDFLRSTRFSTFRSGDRDEFFHDVRNGLLHNGETRGDWKVRIDTRGILYKDPRTGARTINRRLFHAAIVREFREYCRKLEGGTVEIHSQFLRRMDAICGARFV